MDGKLIPKLTGGGNSVQSNIVKIFKKGIKAAIVLLIGFAILTPLIGPGFSGLISAAALAAMGEPEIGLIVGAEAIISLFIPGGVL